MLYLSLLSLNPRSRQVQSELRDSYQMHRTLAKAFGDAHQVARCLFRVEDDGVGLRALVQSHVRPDWSALSVPPGYWATPPRLKAFTPAFAVGQTLAFRLRANPTVRRGSVRLGLYDEDEQLGWLARKAEANGFLLRSALTRDQGKVSCRTAAGQTATFSAVTFDGILQVVNTAALLAAVEGGIGAAKGVGFGLLSLAPVK